MPKGDFILVLSGILILGAVAAGIVLAAFLQRRTRHRRASFDGSCAAAARWLHLATRTPSFARGETVVERRPVAVELQRGTMEHPTFVRVWTPIDVQSPARGAYRRPSSKPVMTAATTVLRRKTRTDRLGDRLHLHRPLGTGDLALDARVHIETEASRDTLALVLSEPAALAALSRLFTAGVDRIDLLVGTPTLTAVLRDPTPERLLSLPEIAADLAALAEALPDLAPAAVGRLRRFRQARLPIAIAMAGAFGLAATFLLEGSVHIVDPDAVGTLFQIGLLAWLPLCGAAYLAFRGRCRSMHDFLYSTMALLVASPALALGAGIWLNALLDRDPAEPHVTRVVALTTTENWRGGPPSHSVTLRSWRIDWPDTSFEPPSSRLSLLVPNHMVKVMTRPGRFGWEWISDLEPVLEPQPDPSKFQ